MPLPVTTDATVAVNVTESPKVGVADEETTVVVVELTSTVVVAVAERPSSPATIYRNRVISGRRVSLRIGLESRLAGRKTQRRYVGCAYAVAPVDGHRVREGRLRVGEGAAQVYLVAGRDRRFIEAKANGTAGIRVIHADRVRRGTVRKAVGIGHRHGDRVRAGPRILLERIVETRLARIEAEAGGLAAITPIDRNRVPLRRAGTRETAVNSTPDGLPPSIVSAPL